VVSDGRGLRVFIADAAGTDWTEVTGGGAPTVRLQASDLQQAQRARRRIAGSVAVILDITVLVADDFRSARSSMAAVDVESGSALPYAGTLDGLAGLIADIFMAGVADGVTLIPAAPHHDVRALAEATLARIADRVPVARAA
jgi:hypothetical protein